MVSLQYEKNKTCDKISTLTKQEKEYHDRITGESEVAGAHGKDWKFHIYWIKWEYGMLINIAKEKTLSVHLHKSALKNLIKLPTIGLVTHL